MAALIGRSHGRFAQELPLVIVGSQRSMAPLPSTRSLGVRDEQMVGAIRVQMTFALPRHIFWAIHGRFANSKSSGGKFTTGDGVLITSLGVLSNSSLIRKARSR